MPVPARSISRPAPKDRNVISMRIQAASRSCRAVHFYLFLCLAEEPGQWCRRGRGKEDMIMVMTDFGEDELLPSLDRCVSLSNLFGGMGPSNELPRIARTQFYFVDACRAVPEVLKKYERLEPRIVFPVE